jgi:hypothetical protein
MEFTHAIESANTGAFGIEYILGTFFQFRLGPAFASSPGNSVLRSAPRHRQSVHGDRHDAFSCHVLYPHAPNIGQR